MSMVLNLVEEREKYTERMTTAQKLAASEIRSGMNPLDSRYDKIFRSYTRIVNALSCVILQYDEMTREQSGG